MICNSSIKTEQQMPVPPFHPLITLFSTRNPPINTNIIFQKEKKFWKEKIPKTPFRKKAIAKAKRLFLVNFIDKLVDGLSATLL